MSRHPTIIRTLMDLRHGARERNEAVDVADEDRNDPGSEWAYASRVWSRQGDALLLAVIAEPPTSIQDALSVLCCLAELRRQHDINDDQPQYRDRDVTEITDVAIHNCIAAIARNDQGRDLPETENADLEWSAKQVQRWLPPAAEGRAA